MAQNPSSSRPARPTEPATPTSRTPTNQTPASQAQADAPASQPDNLSISQPADQPASPLTATPFIHPTALIDEGARIGAGTRIWHWVHLCAGAEIGERCSLGQNVFVGKARLGNNVRVQNNVSIYDGVELEDDVFCGPSMVFTNVINPRSHVPRKAEYRPIRVRRGASIGANATIVCGVTIGEYAMVGAGAVVSRDVAPHALVTGVPARRLGWVCWCGTRLSGQSDVSCPECNRRYRIGPDACVPLDTDESPSSAPS